MLGYNSLEHASQYLQDPAQHRRRQFRQSRPGLKPNRPQKLRNKSTHPFIPETKSNLNKQNHHPKISPNNA